MNVVTDFGLNLSGLTANSAKDNLAYIEIKVKISSVEQLNSLMKKIRSVSGVKDIFRVNN